MSHAKQDIIDDLTNKSVLVLREAFSKRRKIAALWSTGKDSTAILSLAREAFQGTVPFPVIHIDNSIDFPESYRFRDRLQDDWNLEVVVAKSNLPHELSEFNCCGSNKTDSLRNVMREYGFDSLIVSTRKDEPKSRTNDDFLTLTSQKMERDDTNQAVVTRDNHWRPYLLDEYLQISPLMDWNENDVWRYTLTKKIPVNPLYFSVNGYRYKRLGCAICTIPEPSNAKTIPDILSELGDALSDGDRRWELDKEREYIKQRLRQLGYM